MTRSATLIIYMLEQSENEWIRIPAPVAEHQDRLTRVVKESYSWSPKASVSVGDRLSEHQIVGAVERKVIPNEFVVDRIENYGAETGNEFAGIKIAYCKRQPLSDGEVEAQSYVAAVKVPAVTS
ncbi:MAG: hypothetical protein AAF685_06125 [Cyanobacteria bacterium P01_C01_bin.89]